MTLRTGVLRALAVLPDGHGLTANARGYTELLSLAAWFQPALRAHLATDATGELTGLDEVLDRMAATLTEAALLGVVAHGALTPAGRALCRLLEAGAAHHYPAVPGAGADPSARGSEGLGEDLALRPTLAKAVTTLREELHAALPEPSDKARFQSDLTATVTGAPAPALADLLSAVGDIESEGHAVVWRISATSIRWALDAGWTADELLDRLTEASERDTPLPQPLAYTIKDTARTHGQLKVVRSACCIRSDDTALIAEVAQARGLAKLRLRRIAPTVLISTAPPEETLSALRTAGYAPTQEAETGTTLLDRAPTDRAPTLMPTLDHAHAAYGEPGRGAPASARLLAATLTAAG
ncbi:helicase-associated domain-containing protein [Streptomyces sp. P9-A4]|uniref:helicase-associated domain-containing protein n=1 Tax=Streptomyces sp. P9-A4 TaxID=3072285 RepID=UPI002FCC0599